MKERLPPQQQRRAAISIPEPYTHYNHTNNRPIITTLFHHQDPIRPPPICAGTCTSSGLVPTVDPKQQQLPPFASSSSAGEGDVIVSGIFNHSNMDYAHNHLHRHHRIARYDHYSPKQQHSHKSGTVSPPVTSSSPIPSPSPATKEESCDDVMDSTKIQFERLNLLNADRRNNSHHKMNLTAPNMDDANDVRMERSLGFTTSCDDSNSRHSSQHVTVVTQEGLPTLPSTVISSDSESSSPSEAPRGVQIEVFGDAGVTKVDEIHRNVTDCQLVPDESVSSANPNQYGSVHPPDSVPSMTTASTVPSMSSSRKHFLIFIKILFKVLDQANEEATRNRAKKIVAECTRKNRMGDPHFTPLMEAVEKRLRLFVSQAQWHKAQLLWRHYCKMTAAATAGPVPSLPTSAP